MHVRSEAPSNNALQAFHSNLLSGLVESLHRSHDLYWMLNMLFSVVILLSLLVFTVINLLRAPSVDMYIAQGKTLGIAEHNERRLQAAGRQHLKATFDRIMAMP